MKMQYLNLVMFFSMLIPAACGAIEYAGVYKGAGSRVDFDNIAISGNRLFSLQTVNGGDSLKVYMTGGDISSATAVSGIGIGDHYKYAMHTGKDFLVIVPVDDETENYLQVIKISENLPVVVGNLLVGKHLSDAVLSGTSLYIVTDINSPEQGFDISAIRLENQSKPTKAGSVFVTYKPEICTRDSLLFFIAQDLDSFSVVNFKDLSKPEIISTGVLPQENIEGSLVVQTAISEQYVYVLRLLFDKSDQYSVLSIYDFKNLHKPTLFKQLFLDRYPHSLVIRNKSAIVTCNDKLYTIDISGVGNSCIEDSVIVPANIEGTSMIAASDSMIYVAYGFGVMVLDRRKKHLSFERSVSTVVSSVNSIIIKDNLAYALMSEIGLYIYDITNPAKPLKKGVCHNIGNPLSIDIVNTTAYIASDCGLVEVDIKKPDEPLIVSKILALSSGEKWPAKKNSSKGPYVGVLFEDRFSLIDTSLKSEFMFEDRDINYRDCSSILLTDNYVYMTFIEDLKFGYLKVYNLNPFAVVGAYKTNGEPRDVLVKGQYSFVANGSSGLTVFSYGDILSQSVTPGVAVRMVRDSCDLYVLDSCRAISLYDISNPGKPSLKCLIYTEVTPRCIATFKKADGSKWIVVGGGRYDTRIEFINVSKVSSSSGLQSPGTKSISKTSDINTIGVPILGTMYYKTVWKEPAYDMLGRRLTSYNPLHMPNSVMVPGYKIFKTESLEK